MTDNSKVYPHGNVEAVAENIFMVRGSINVNPVVRISRNMAIVRHGDELSLINPVRVNSQVESEIDALGKISHVVRLGAFHGLDDAYYVNKYSAVMWAQEGGTTYTQPKIEKVISADCQLPFPNAKVFEFSGSLQPECVVLISTGAGLLLTCDAIQNYGDYSYNNLLAKLLMPFIGFPKTTIVGPIWLKYMTPENGSLEFEFRKLLNLEFDSLLAAHGTLLRKGAKNAVAKAIDKVFPPQAT
ncbi:MAG: hypothetical protein AB8B95_09740 [Pseudohongiellaceae bacterium]